MTTVRSSTGTQFTCLAAFLIALLYFVLAWFGGCSIQQLKTHRARRIMNSPPAWMIYRATFWLIVGQILNWAWGFAELLLCGLIEYLLVFWIGWTWLFGWKYATCDFFFAEDDSSRSSSSHSRSPHNGSSSQWRACDVSSDYYTSDDDDDENDRNGSSSRRRRHGRDSSRSGRRSGDYSDDGYGGGGAGCCGGGRRLPPIDARYIGAVFIVELIALLLGALLLPVLRLAEGAYCVTAGQTYVWVWWLVAISIGFLVIWFYTWLVNEFTDCWTRTVLLNPRTLLLVDCAVALIIGELSGGSWLYALGFAIIWFILAFFSNRSWSQCGDEWRAPGFVVLDGFVWPLFAFLVGVFILRVFTVMYYSTQGDSFEITGETPGLWNSLKSGMPLYS